MNSLDLLIAVAWKIVCFQKLTIALFAGGLLVAWILDALKATKRRDEIQRDNGFIRFPLKKKD